MNKYFMFRRFGRNGEREDSAAQGHHNLILCRVGEHPDYPKAPFAMCFTREALCALVDSVGVRPPESGAMGFSPADHMGFDLVEFSSSGSANSGGAVYRPDSEWGLSRCQHHQNQPVEAMRLWSGDLHSHPGGMGHPSGKSGRALGDLGYVEEVFEMTEWMEWFFIPILTGTGTDDVTIHPWVCRRGRPVELMIADLQVCSASRFPKRVFNADWQERCAKAAEERARREAEAEATRRAKAAEQTPPPAEGKNPPPPPPARPSAPKVTIRITDRTDNTRRVVRVPVTKEDKEDRGSATPKRVASDGDAAVQREQCPAGQYYADESSTAVLDTPRQETESAEDREALLSEYTKRLNGVVSPAFRQKTILVVGVGAGSYAVEKLVRLCPKAIRICDFDIVELPNLARTAYTVRDAAARRFKVDALAFRAAEINPWVEIRPYSASFTRMSPFQVDEMFEGVDLVIGGTDSLEAQALVNEQSVRRGIPAVFIGIHAGAQGGRVVWSIPGETPCYRCVARDRFDSSAEGQSEAADLTAATGSILDCQFIDMLATKIAVAILERGQDSAMGRFFRKMGRRTDVVIRCDPAYEWGQALWGAVLADLPKSPKDFARELNEEAFLAMDSIWLKSTYDPDCPVCGGRKADADIRSHAGAGQEVNVNA
jgi:molybdopterin/thiamine biosynthesis adenylyltransferase